MSKSFTVEGKTYVVKHIEKDLYLDQFGYMSTYSKAFTAIFDTKKEAQMAYRNGKTAACCIIIEEKDVMTYA